MAPPLGAPYTRARGPLSRTTRRNGMLRRGQLRKRTLLKELLNNGPLGRVR